MKSVPERYSHFNDTHRKSRAKEEVQNSFTKVWNRFDFIGRNLKAEAPRIIRKTITTYKRETIKSFIKKSWKGKKVKRKGVWKAEQG